MFTIYTTAIHKHVGGRRKLRGRSDSQLALDFESECLYCGIGLRPTVATVKLLNSLGLY
jgi:hypothetical protein